MKKKIIFTILISHSLICIIDIFLFTNPVLGLWHGHGNFHDVLWRNNEGEDNAGRFDP